MVTILSLRTSREAIAFGDVTMDYEGLARRVAAATPHFDGGAKRVAIFAENRPEWAIAAYAVWSSGGVIVPIDYLSTATEVAYILDDACPSVVCCSRGKRSVLEAAIAASGCHPRILVLEDDFAAEDEAKAVEVDERTEAAILYTSGTTGDPKGVVLSFGNLMANVRAVADDGYFTPEACVLLILPLHHVLPLAGSLVAPLFAGSKIVMATSLAGEVLLVTMARHQVTTIIGVPRFYDVLANTLRERIFSSPVGRVFFAAMQVLGSPGLSRRIFAAVHRKFGGRLRILVCGGAALTPETGRTFATLGFEVCEGFGMTECAPMITFPRYGKAKLGTCGQVLPGSEIRIVDGEIVTRGPNVMVGYLGRERETAEIIRDGWLYTGDLGHLDEEGRLTVTGRRKDILVLPNGKKVNPSLIEDALMASPVVREAGVFQDGDTLHALLVSKQGGAQAQGSDEVSAAIRNQIIDPYNAGVAPHKRITRFTVIESDLPRTRLGKLRRHLLPGIAAENAKTIGRPADEKRDDDPVLKELVSFLSRRTAGPVLGDSRFRLDLGLDSLARLELAMFLEQKFGVAISEAGLVEFETVRDLSDFLHNRREPASGSAVSWSDVLSGGASLQLPRSTWWHWAIMHVSRLLVRLLFRVHVQGVARLPERACIIAPNHQSFIDGVFVTAFMQPGMVLRTLFYAKQKHVRRTWVRFLADRANVIVADATETIRHSLQKVASALRRGSNVIIFPEGTRSTDGELSEFKETYAIIATELGLPIVPVVIDGANDVLPPGRTLPRPLRRVSVTYLDPVEPIEGETAADLNRRIQGLITQQLVSGRAGKPSK